MYRVSYRDLIWLCFREEKELLLLPFFLIPSILEGGRSSVEGSDSGS